MIAFIKVFHASSLGVNVLHSFVSSILANILSWEDESVIVSSLQRVREMSVVDHWKSELFEISHEPGENMSLWHRES